MKCHASSAGSSLLSITVRLHKHVYAALLTWVTTSVQCHFDVSWTQNLSLPFPDSVWTTHSCFWHCENRSERFKDDLSFPPWLWESLLWRAGSCSQSCHCSAHWSFDLLSLLGLRWWNSFALYSTERSTDVQVYNSTSIESVWVSANGTSWRAEGSHRSPCAYVKNSWKH